MNRRGRNRTWLFVTLVLLFGMWNAAVPTEEPVLVASAEEEEEFEISGGVLIRYNEIVSISPI